MSKAGVRIGVGGGVSRAALRRRPSQPRARATQQALQDAFVQVLLDTGFAAMTVREVAGVAGVSIGSFYEYQDSKYALAALTIHQRIRALGRSLRDQARRLHGRPMRDLIETLLDQHVDTVRCDAPAWAALFLLERQISSPAAYRNEYRRFVQDWEAALAEAGDAPAAEDIAALARMVHVLVYGWLSQSLLMHGTCIDWRQLRDELGRAVRGCLWPVG